MRRVLDVDPLECPRCHGTMRLVSVVMEPGAIRTILATRGCAPRLSADHSARGPPQMQLALEQNRGAAAA